MSINEFDLTVKLHEGRRSVVWRAKIVKDNTPVVLKILRDPHPDPEEIARFKREFEITTRLQGEGIIRFYEMVPHENSWLIIVEDFGGESLTRLRKMDRSAPDLRDFLDLAIRVVAILGEIHRQNVIHKDINPSNIVLNPETGVVKIIDFGISAELRREKADRGDLEGTPPYISPEQTGRMNRSIDYRSDFYALGVTFYELLTGQPPFKEKDLLECVHAHIAKTPVPPVEIDPTIPVILSDLILKLMAKNAEHRYQSASGLKADLERIRDGINQENDIFFELGRRDFSDRLNIPQKLYGREDEIGRLLSAFERVCAGETEMLLVAGYSGIGKTSLVREVHIPIVEKGGYFIFGKFDQFKRNSPYAAVIEAFQDLARQLLTETEARIAGWREKILEAVGVNGRVIVNVIPEMEFIIGPQPDIAALGATESQNRFDYVFQNFIRVFADASHPLTLFLDDLQWIDLPSLNLIELFMSDIDVTGLLLVGAYRENEVDEAHPLTASQKRMKARGRRIRTIVLPPLPFDDVNQLMADVVCRDAEETRPFSELALRKTGGNPFFMLQFIEELYHRNLIFFHRDRAAWRWDAAAIENAGFTDNIADLMAKKVGQWPLETRESLKYGAALGKRFSLKMLALTTGRTHREIASDLWPALRNEFLLPTNVNYRYTSLSDGKAFEAFAGNAEYRFAHDRIQQAAYSLIPEKERGEFHYHIGRILLESLAEDEREDHLFDIVHHLNHGKQADMKRDERSRLAALNLRAGKKAKAANAYQPALAYFRRGLDFTRETFWRDHRYGTVYELSVESIHSEYLNGDYENAEKLVMDTLPKTTGIIDKARICNLYIVQLTMLQRYGEALDLAKEILSDFGLTLPAENLGEAVREEIDKINETVGGRDIRSFIDLGEMRIPEKIMLVELLHNLAPLTFQAAIELFPLLVSKIVRLSLEHGNTPLSSIGYATYGFFYGPMTNDYAAAHHFAALGMELSDRYNDKSCQCITRELNIAQIVWKQHVKLAEPMSIEGFRFGIESGEFQWASYLHLWHSYNLVFQGMNLEELNIRIWEYLPFAEKIKDQLSIDAFTAIQLWIDQLTHGDAPETHSGGAPMTEDEFIAALDDHKGVMNNCLFHILKSQTLWHRGRFETALRHSEKAGELIASIGGSCSLATWNFFNSLILLALCDKSPAGKQTEFKKQISANQKQMKIWSDNCPENFFHKYILVEAEIARVESRNWEAADLYDQSIDSARENGFTQNEAIANELAAGFWMGKGKQKIAAVYLRGAHHGYRLWGASRKVRELERNHSHMMLEGAQPAQTPGEEIGGSTDTSTTASLDVASLTRAMNTLSAELAPDELLKKMLATLLENAGAQTAMFTLRRRGEFVIVGRASSETGAALVEPPAPLEEKNDRDQPAGVIRYVARTRHPLALDDAGRAAQFGRDPYIVRHGVKSVLAAPVMHQGRLTGVIYLENNLATAAFPPARLKTVTLLAAQAAVALENASLYATLEQKVRDRTVELEAEIGERKLTEKSLQESEAQKTAILNGITVNIAFVNRNFEILWLNKAAADSVNKKPEEMIGRRCHEFWGNSEKPCPNCPTSRAFHSRKSEHITIVTPDGRIWDEKGEPVFNPEGDLIGVVEIAEDITDRKRAEDALRNALAEKEVLLREIHHRVKNNMQVIVSLLRMHARKNQDPHLKLIFDECRDRIEAMSLIHEALYQSDDLSRIDFESYLKKLCRNLAQAHHARRKSITLTSSAADVTLNMDQGIAVGMIIAELISNAFKHAFPSGRSGNATVGMTKLDAETVELTVADDGKGLPPDFALHGNQSLGMRLVSGAVTRELGGSIEAESDGGAKFVIRFKCEEGKQRSQ